MLLVREANGGDADDITALLFLLTDDARVSVLPERLEEVRASADSFVFVIVEGDSLLGTAQVTLCPDVMYGRQPYAVVENVIVREELRGTGLGRMLMHEIERLCRERDCSKIMFLSSAAKTDAHRFYRGLGYNGDAKKGFVKYRSALVESAS